MATAYRDKLRAVAGGFVAGAVALTLVATGAQAQTSSEEYTATIWIDPDGCELWVMDDGAEGYMDARRTRDGGAVCHRSAICGVIPSDQLFVTDEAWI